MIEIIEFPKIFDPRGNLTFLQYPDQIPFDIERVFWTYDLPSGKIRGGHAFKKQKEIIIALCGSFDVVITNKDGVTSTFSLNRSYQGLYIPEKNWRHIEKFSSNALGLHISSKKFDENDYIRDLKSYNNE